jgi:hypothetical protein
MIVAGLLFIILGGVFLKQATVPERENKINDYNAAVQVSFN